MTVKFPETKTVSFQVMTLMEEIIYGLARAQISMAWPHLGWKGQPEGRLMGLGGSPLSSGGRKGRSGSGRGTAASVTLPCARPAGPAART